MEVTKEQNLEGKEEAGYADPLYLSTGDNSNMKVGSIILNESNYLLWSRSANMALGSKNKLGFVDGTCLKPESGTPSFSKWVRNDAMVRCWILNSVEPTIASGLLLISSAKELWEELKERYGEITAPHLYLLKKEVNDWKQNNNSVSTYYCKLKNLWDEISSLEGFPECSCGALSKCSCNLLKKIKEREERNKVIDFLNGLNGGFDNLKENILGMDPLPSVNRAFHMAQQAEKQKQIASLCEVVPEVSAMAVQKHLQHGYGRKESKEEKMKKRCDYCNFRGHTKETCFKIHGVPEWYKSLKGKTGMEGQGKGKTSQRYAGNVRNEEQEELDDNPLEGKEDDCRGKKMDAEMIAAVAQQVMKMFNERGTSSSNAATLGGFAGPFN